MTISETIPTYPQQPSVDEVELQQRAIIVEETAEALRYLYNKGRVRDYRLEKHVANVQMPLTKLTLTSQSAAAAERRELNAIARRKLKEQEEFEFDDEGLPTTMTLITSQTSVQLSTVSIK